MDPVREATAPCPIPLRAIVFRLLNASDVTVMVPLRVPARLGVKVMSSVQNPPAPKPVPQLCVSAKSPVAVMLAMFRARLPVLFRLTLCFALVVLRF